MSSIRCRVEMSEYSCVSPGTEYFSAVVDALKNGCDRTHCVHGQNNRAAALLGISRTTLYAALRTCDIATTSVSRS
jgi:DNA-binding NtrC family response regulator